MFSRASILSLVLAAGAGAALPPQLQSHDNFQNVVRLSDGTLWRLASRFNAVYRSVSTDNGLTWQGTFTTQTKLFDAFGGLNPNPVVDRATGARHLFIPRRPDAGPVEFDVWHYQSNPQLTSWSTGEMIHDGDTGSMLKWLQTSTGRFVVPFGDSATPPPAGYGNNQVLIRYADAGAATYLLSPSVLRSPVPTGWNGASDGACEPAIIEKADHSLWMLMRSQTGKLTQSFSGDFGATWTPAANSNFYTSTGPPCLVPMDNGDIVLLWNNATMPGRYNGSIWYGGRDVLHAAISRDQGQSWQGFREIYLDPFRNENPVSGDTGTAYPFATATADGKIIAITGQAAAKAQLRIDPAWLLEKDVADDFTSASPLARWSVFKPYGDVVNVKRNRVVGATIIDDPDPGRTKNVLFVRKPDDKDPDGATWNFPMAARGLTKLRIKFQPGFGGGAIALTDRFFNPTDPQGDTGAFFRLPISPAGVLPGGQAISLGQWHDLTLDWKTATRSALISIDGGPIATLMAQNGVEVWPGLSYLRLRSTANSVDTAGFIVDSVSHTGTRLREAAPMSTVALATALGELGWPSLSFDRLAPNQNVTPANLSGNGVTGTLASPVTLTSRSTTAGDAGIVIESSTGTVTFIDATSTRVTSDLLGPTIGQTLTIRFVDPADPARPAVVSEVAWRLGSVLADDVAVQLFDIEGKLIPDFSFTAMPGGISGMAGYSALKDDVTQPLVHSIRFTGGSSDVWVLGSFTLDSAAADFAYRGFRVVPEPWTSALIGGLIFARRARHAR